ncbi:Probable peptide methionine sulfoxide [Sparassis crispa]|uniref:peptide-methionine (S)-S-oxide reductase n=1 Tax=Sparassis crispa TaxID=139825 RepID=A0A401GX81_9APHY|nr:Probable peptide methionine sulfoxide [Sparassis crispa]GBE86831.1 Probable peptide methionine sulfoxide [Sparassis crispa]
MSQMFVLHPLFALLLLLFAICHAAPMLESRAGTQVATFAGGCFWGVEDLFTKQFTKGLSKTTTGYIGGSAPNPKYRDVCSGATGHAEAVRFEFNPSVVKYDDLVEFFYRSHDPTVANRQGSDVGSQYRSVIFYTTPQQQAIAQKVTQDVQKRSSSQVGVVI